jgi:hypothetical protein
MRWYDDKSKWGQLMSLAAATHEPFAGLARIAVPSRGTLRGTFAKLVCIFFSKPSHR